jgi:ABC-type uncharacterized transport system involved in gliding motility auxiliary subunit
VTPLAYTSEQTGLVSPPTMVDIEKRWTENDFNESSQVVAVALEGPMVGQNDARLVVVSNGDFAVNGEPGQQQQVNPDNVNLQVNAIDWLADDTGLIDLRTKGITSRPLDKKEEATQLLYQYGNVLIPVFLLLIYAFYRKQQNAQKRRQWLEGNY